MVVPGTRSLEVTAVGYERLQKEVTLVPDEANTIQVELSVLPEYQERVETRQSKQSLGAIFRATAIASAVGGAGLLYWAGHYTQAADDSWALYHAATEKSEYDKHYADIEKATESGQLFQNAALGLFGVAALSLGFSVYSYATSPDALVTETGVEVGVAPIPGGAMMSLVGQF